MVCNRCQGRMFLDRVFTDNVSFELSCLHCGHRQFVKKDTELGQWLKRQEARAARALDGLV